MIKALVHFTLAVVMVSSFQTAYPQQGTIPGFVLKFDGADDRVDAGSLDISGENITIEAWFRAEDFANCPASDCRIISKATGASESEHWWMISTVATGAGNRLRFRLKTAGITSTLIATSGELSEGRWIHVAAVYDGREMRLYQDGILVGSLAKTGVIDSNPAARVWIGDNPPSTGSRPFKGDIDEVRIWDGPLTEEEIRNNRGIELTGTEPGLFAYWKFNEGFGQVALDSTLNGRNAILGATPEADASDPAWTIGGAPFDVTPPAISILEPPDGVIVDGEITISATASDDIGLEMIEFKLDGNPLGQVAGTAPYSVLWDTTTSSNCEHILTAIATDTSGNQSTSGEIRVIVANVSSSRTTHYVRGGANGNNTGSDWNNAYDQVPEALLRGHTYYIAGGQYEEYMFDDPSCGASVITIKKATAADHGTTAGWDDSYGDEAAVFPRWNFAASFYDVDGQARSSDWQSGYGFKIKMTETDGIFLAGHETLTDINIRFVEIEGLGLDNPAHDDGIRSRGVANLALSHSYLHDFGRAPVLTRNLSNVLFEYNYVARNSSDAAFHAEAWSDSGSDNVTIRYNLWADIEGTGVIVALEGPSIVENWDIYGNVFFYTDGNPHQREGLGNGAIAVINTQSAVNWRIYNNSFVNLNYGHSSRIDFDQGPDQNHLNNVVYNNLWYNCKNAFHIGVSESSHNTYINTDHNVEPAQQIKSNDPFLDYPGQNFRLSAPTEPGRYLPAPFHLDLDETIRGADGVWDRGAYEFFTPEDSQLPLSTTFGPPSPSNLSGMIADPVNTATGNYLLQQTDLSLASRGFPIAFRRTYNSLDSYSGPLGTGWTHSYNIFLLQHSEGTVTVKQSDGREEFYIPVGDSLLHFKARFGGVFSELIRNPDRTFVLTTKKGLHHFFDETGRLTHLTDGYGNTVSLIYDQSGNLTEIIDTMGRRALTLNYSGDRISEILDLAGRSIQYGYDPDGNLVAVTDPLGDVTIFRYDDDQRLATVSDPQNQTLLENSYDALGRVIKQINGRGFSTLFQYATPASGDTSITDPAGNTTVHTHDEKLRLIRITQPDGNTTTYTYDTQNNRTSITDPNSHVIRLGYDDRGNLTSIRDPLDNLSSFVYDDRHNLVTATTAGNITTFSYDDNRSLIRVTDALGNARILTYDDLGQLVEETDARGNTTRYHYDEAGNLARITDPLGNATRLFYDELGRLVRVQDSSDHSTRATYDLENRLTGIVDPLENVARFTYDPRGNLVAITDALEHITRYDYDMANNLMAVTDALGNVTRYEYDINNNLVKVVDANQHSTDYSYDSVNRLIRITDPLGGVTSLTYDAAGNVIALTDANGTTNHFEYDANDRLTGIQYGDLPPVLYTYDARGNRESMIDSRGTTHYSFDPLNRLVEVVHPDGNRYAYDYDPEGNRTSITHPDGSTALYTYDPLNRLVQVIDPDGQSINYGYDPDGNLSEVVYPNEAAIQFGYDPAHRLVNVTNLLRGNLLSSFAYTLDPLGNRLSVIEDGKRAISYRYDALSRLVSVDSNRHSVEYLYDSAGNRMSATGEPGQVDYVYDSADRLLRAGETTFDYDHNGNRVAANNSAITSYVYDAANRLIRISRGGQVSTLAYDGDGNKVSQTIGSRVYRFTLDSSMPIPAILTETGPQTESHYVYGLGLISRTNRFSQYFYHYDGAGNIVTLTDRFGSPNANYAYGPWGEAEGGGHASTELNRFRFTGEELDEFTGLYYFRSRWYDANVGRFISPDQSGWSLLQPQSLNRYAYALNNPMRFVSPDGDAVPWNSGLGAMHVNLPVGETKARTGEIPAHLIRFAQLQLGLNIESKKSIHEALIGSIFGLFNFPGKTYNWANTPYLWARLSKRMGQRLWLESVFRKPQAEVLRSLLGFWPPFPDSAGAMAFPGAQERGTAKPFKP